MRTILMLSLLASMSSPALALYKCEANGKTSYSDEPCSAGATRMDISPNTKVSPPDAANASRQAAREKAELKRLENEREKREAQEHKEREKLARTVALKQKKCNALALQKKWSEEDAAAATGKSVEHARRNARRKAEKYQMECGK
jgi:hypothetical protein